MGREVALQTSGWKWLPPFLGQLLEDPYDVVRFVAYHSLLRLPAFSDFEYDYVGPVDERAAGRLRVEQIWKRLPVYSDRLPDQMILIGPDGNLQQGRFDRLLRQRDDRPVQVVE